MGTVRTITRRSLPLLLHSSVTSSRSLCLAVTPVYPPSLQNTSGSAASISRTDFIYRHAFNDGPFAAFKTGRINGLYRPDPRQEAVVLKLQELYQRLAALPSVQRGSSLTLVDNMDAIQSHSGTSNWFSGIAQMMNNKRSNGISKKRNSVGSSAKDDRGLYLYGGVGVGKTMLMDLFVASRPTNVKVMRTHFHDFMLDVHGRLKDQSGRPDPLKFVAKSISEEVTVLALDELFVSDVADAMIINRLFRTLWDDGMVLLSTSNRRPDDLYLGGLQRDLFLPFIDNLKDCCVVHDMQSEIDYRRLAHCRGGIFFSGGQADLKLREAFERKTAGLSKRRDVRIALRMGRSLMIPLSVDGLCYFTFEELCERPLGSDDYLGLCRYYHTVFVEAIPIVTDDNRSAAYRWMTLIDILYDHRIRVLCSAKGDAGQLFKNVISHAESVERTDGDWFVDDKLSFAKERTISRLTEMGTTEYLVEHANRHAPELLLALAEKQEKAKLEEVDALLAATT